MDRENFNAIITRYLDKFDDTNGISSSEWFKWEAVYHFQEYWDIDADDFAAMFVEATKEFNVLIDTNQSMPINGLKLLVKKPNESEFVRDAIRQLFDEDSGDLSLRQAKAELFVEGINKHITKYWSNTHLYLQNMRSAMLLLAMNKPADNYILFWSRASEWAKCIEFGEDIGSGADFSLATYYRMCDELLFEIERSTELKACAQKRLDAAKVSINRKLRQHKDIQLNDGYHLLVYDIMYCAYCYGLYIDIPTYNNDTAKKRIERSKERKELDQLKADILVLEQERKELDSIGQLPPDLVGHSVISKYFGIGTISEQRANIIKVRFDHREPSFEFPTVFIEKKLIPILDDDRMNIENHAMVADKICRLKKSISDLRKKYSAKEEIFAIKRHKSIQNEFTYFGDE